MKFAVITKLLAFYLKYVTKPLCKVVLTLETGPGMLAKYTGLAFSGNQYILARIRISTALRRGMQDAWVRYKRFHFDIGKANL